jgi:hypothetical protein
MSLDHEDTYGSTSKKKVNLLSKEYLDRFFSRLHTQFSIPSISHQQAVGATRFFLYKIIGLCGLKIPPGVSSAEWHNAHLLEPKPEAIYLDNTKM